MSIYGNPVFLGGGGGGTIISKTITANGTYNALSDNADGYNPVIVNTPSDIETWDFTSSPQLVGKTRGIVITVSSVLTFGSEGAIFDSAADYIKIPTLQPLEIEIEVPMMQLSSGTHRRFVMGTDSNGLIYRSTGKWAFYNGTWEDSGELSGSFFDDSTVKIIVDSDSKWHIYKDGVLWWEPTGSQALTAPGIGSSSQSINNAVIGSLILR